MPGPKSFRTILRRERRIFALEPKAMLGKQESETQIKPQETRKEKQ